MGPVSTVGQIVTVVGIGADGWSGLAEPGREAVRAAEVVLGGPRQLDLVAGYTEAELRTWPSPMLSALPGLFAQLSDRRVGVLASGDPMFHGVGATLARCSGRTGCMSCRTPRRCRWRARGSGGPSTGSRSSARSPGRSPGSVVCSHRARGCWC